MPKKPTKAQIKKERDPKKREEVLMKKGYSSGKLPKGQVLHHVKEVQDGGKTTSKNTMVHSEAKHIKIHQGRAKK